MINGVGVGVTLWVPALVSVLRVVAFVGSAIPVDGIWVLTAGVLCTAGVCKTRGDSVVDGVVTGRVASAGNPEV